MPRERRSKAWTVLAAGLVTVGALLAPVAVIATGATAELTNTDRFVDAFAPLAKDPAVQKLVAEQTSQVVGEQVDLDAIASDAIGNLVTGPLASAALLALSGAATGGLQSVVDAGITSFVASDAFASAWTQALRSSHPQIMAALRGDPQSALSFGADGSIGIQLAPIVAQVRQSLIDQGLSFASLIPAVDKTVAIGQTDALPTIQAAYRFLTTVGPWLPWISIVLLVAGVLVARRRSIALLAAGLALSLGMVLALIVLAVGRSAAISSIDPNVLPATVMGSLFATLTADMRVTAIVVLVAGLLGAMVGWLAGPSGRARSARSWATTRFNRMRGSAPAAPPA